MMEKMIPRRKRAIFNSFTQKQQVYDFLAEEFNLRPHPVDLPDNLRCIYDETNFRERLSQQNTNENYSSVCLNYSSDNTPGKFFLEKAQEDFEQNSDDDEEFFQAGMFDVI